MSEKYLTCIFKILSYPKNDFNVAKNRYEILRSIGVEEILLDNGILINGCKILGKGTNALAVKAKFRGQLCVIKILRLDATRASLLHEVNFLEELSKLGISPEVYHYNNWFIIEEYVDGIPFLSFLYNINIPKDIIIFKLVVNDILKKAYILDTLGIDHGELGGKGKHIIVEINNNVKIIDFESASKSRKPKNFSSIIQFIFRNTETGNKYLNYIGKSFTKLIPLIKEYKSGRFELYDKIISFLELNI